MTLHNLLRKYWWVVLAVLIPFSFTADLHAANPTSNFTLEWAFNGAGVLEAGGYPTICHGPGFRT